METTAMKQKDFATVSSRNRFRPYALIPVVAFLFLVTASAQKKNSCVECHSKMEERCLNPWPCRKVTSTMREACLALIVIAATRQRMKWQRRWTQEKAS